MQLEDPDDDYGHIPLKIRDCATKFQQVAIDVKENLGTIFIGILDEQCTDAHWNDNLMRVRQLLEIPDDRFTEVKVPSMRTNKQRVDYRRCGEETTKALEMINRGVTEFQVRKIRIVRMGTSHSDAMTEAVESLIRGWDIPANEKMIQFISLGDTGMAHWLKFCRSLVLHQFCKEVEFYDTMDYSIYGFVRKRDDKADEMKQMQMLEHMFAKHLPKFKGFTEGLEKNGSDSDSSEDGNDKQDRSDPSQSKSATKPKPKSK